jgi:3',5'-nucleoside bisphosphate phosphatase
MNNFFVDLHVHTTFSDGAFTPGQAVAYAREVGLYAISITDHDMVDGIEPAIAEGKDLGVEVIPGVELSSEAGGPRPNEIHILGYYIDYKDEHFQQWLANFRTARQKRAREILEKLSGLGLKINETRLYEIVGKGAIGRLHFAKTMIEQGLVKNVPDAFKRYLGFEKPAYVPKLRVEPEEAIGMINKVGGISVLAHPYYGYYADNTLISRLAKVGLRGLEVWHTKHSPEFTRLFLKLAKEFDLVATGGSDCHGSYTVGPAGAKNEPMMGTVKVAYSVVAELRKCKEKLDKQQHRA